MTRTILCKSKDCGRFQWSSTHRTRPHFKLNPEHHFHSPWTRGTSQRQWKEWHRQRFVLSFERRELTRCVLTVWIQFSMGIKKCWAKFTWTKLVCMPKPRSGPKPKPCAGASRPAHCYFCSELNWLVDFWWGVLLIGGDLFSSLFLGLLYLPFVFSLFLLIRFNKCTHWYDLTNAPHWYGLTNAPIDTI